MEQGAVNFPFFQPAVTTAVASWVNRRKGETKLGENIAFWDGHDLVQTLQKRSSPFVLLGIPEDIGVRANYGVGGAHTVWEPALRALLNVQSTSRLNGAEILLLGAFDCSSWMEESTGMDPEQLRELVVKIDEAVAPLIATIVAQGKIPLVVGGGHNNAYPLLKGSVEALKRAVHCVNLDAHSDYRGMEGRHSGNGFRYARQAQYLDRYAIIGLHENYNSENIVRELSGDEHIHFSWFEDIFLRQRQDFEQAMRAAFAFTAGAPCGIELDLDCIGHVLSSAVTPSGIAPLQARQYVSFAARQQPVYLHLAEGAAELRDGRKDATTAKLIAYLLTDFMKAVLAA